MTIGDRERSGGNSWPRYGASRSRYGKAFGWLVAWSCLMMAASLTAQNLISEGQRLTATQKYEAALLVYDILKLQDFDDARPYIYSAVTLLEAGREADAALEINLALRRKPARPEDAMSMAKALERMDRLPIASQVLNEFIEQGGNLPPEGLHYLARLLFRQRRGDEALEALNRFAARTPADPRIPPLLGEIQLLRGDLEASLSAFERAVRAYPKNPVLQDGLGRVLQVGNNHEAALTAFRKAVSLEPDNPAYRHSLGLTLVSLGRHQEALEHFEKAAASPEASARVYFDLGNAYRSVGQAEKARQALETFQKLNSQAEAESNRKQKIVQLINQARQQMEKGQAKPAHDSLQRVLAIDADHWEARSMLAKIFLSSGMIPQAEAEIRRLEALDSESSEGNFLAAMFWYQRRDLDKSLKYAEKARHLRPGNPDLRNLLGNLYLAKNRRQEAFREYHAAVKLAPERLDFKANYDVLRRDRNN